MSYKRVIQLRKLKDKVSKRYFVKIRFYHRNVFLFEDNYDVHNLVIDNDWKSISFGETTKLFKELFDINCGDYPLPSKGFDKDRYQKWLVKEEDGFSISLTDEDLSNLRSSRLKGLGV
jgi:hypothetical protein